MKLIHSDIKHGVVKARVEFIDDLYVLSSIISKGDNVKGRTIRKIKIGSDEERKKSIIKKPVTLVLKVENVDFSKYSPILKISGRITEEHEDIPKGSFHTFNIEENSVITIIKEKWLKYEIEKLNDACRSRHPGVLLVILDREEAFFVLVEKYGYKILSEIKGDVPKKMYPTKVSGNFYQTIADSVKEYSERYPSATIVIASPAFWKEELFELLDDSIKSKTVLAGCSAVDKTAIEEVLKRPELKTALKNAKIKDDVIIVNRFLTELSKNNLAVYGLKDVEYCANIGAVEVLLITDGFIIKARQENNYNMVEDIMKNVEAMKGRVVIICSENQPGKSLDALTGIGAILRYKFAF